MSSKRSFIWDIPSNDFIKVVQNSRSINAVVMNYYKHSGNGVTIKARIKHENIDISHFNGKVWAKDIRLNRSHPRYKLTEILV